MTTPNQDALDALTGGPERQLTVADVRLRITPLCTRELPGVLRAAGPLLDLLSELPTEQAIQAALLSQSEALISAVAIAARVDRDWLDARPLDELIEIAGVVIEVNVDFFIHRLLPAMQAMEQRISKRLAAGSGSPPN